jgi:serine/threonine-protein kinase
VLQNLPDDWRVHAARGHALSGLERRADALREAGWLEQSRIYNQDQVTGKRLALQRVIILTHVGESDDALAEIERLLVEPSTLSVHMLRFDMRFDPIRDDPRFQALLVKYDPPQPVPLN